MIESISQVNREVSKQLNISEDIIKSVNAFYWKIVKEEIASCENTSIRINSLGTYVISRTKLWSAIRKVIKEIRYFRSSDKEYKNKSKEEYINECNNRLSLLLERRNDIAILYRNNELKAKAKKSYVNKGNMEE